MTPEPDSPLVTRFCPSPNIEPRRDGREPDLLLLHYTGMESAEGALKWLNNPDSKVSCHYLIDEAGSITQMVAEEMRAWHAGVASWAGEHDINSCSIGIEIHNAGHEFGYPEFPECQMKAVEALCLDIISRHHIAPQRVLAHSDVAPARKADPGEKFDWKRLAESGVGIWVEPEPLKDGGSVMKPGDEGDGVRGVQALLQAYGYGLETTGKYDEETSQVVTAFQRHFRPARVDGLVDDSTRITLGTLQGAPVGTS